ncbi:unnamed protein product, partial [Laminaria digitata]
SRAAYPGGAEHMNTDPNHDRKGGGGPTYARYPLADPRGAHPRAPASWERAPPPQNQGVAERSPPQANFANAYPPPSQQQLQRQHSWSAGRPRGENGAAASSYQQRMHPHQQQQQQQQRQWYRRESHDEGEDAGWEQPGREQYPPARRAPAAAVAGEGHPEHPSAYQLQYGPSSSSRWHDEVEPHAGGPRGGYGGGVAVDGGGGGQRRLQRGGPPPRGYADMPPHEQLRGDDSYDDGDLDDDVTGGKRRRPLPPPLARSTSRGGAPPPGGRAAAAWGEDAGYALPRAPSIRGEDFEKEVVKAAALLVAEREMRAREAARKEEVKRDWPEEADPHRRGRGASGRGEDSRQVSKGRGEGKGESQGRRTSDEKRAAADEQQPKTKPTRRAGSRERHLAESRDRARHRDDSKGKYRDEPRGKPDGRSLAGSGNKDKERHPPSLRGSQTPTEWERNGKRPDLQAEEGRRPWSSGDGAGSRDGGYGGDSGSRGDTGYFVHVGGISFSTTFTTLAKRFAAFGDVNGFKVIFNNVTCRSADISGGGGGAKEEASKAAVVTASTGFAFISFEDERGMEKAIAGLNDQLLDGHVLKVS